MSVQGESVFPESESQQYFIYDCISWRDLKYEKTSTFYSEGHKPMETSLSPNVGSEEEEEEEEELCVT